VRANKPRNWKKAFTRHYLRRSLAKTVAVLSFGHRVLGAPAGIRTPNQQIMRPAEGHQ
jgi:hypothetical protein